jgi:hypothetical protein
LANFFEKEKFSPMPSKNKVEKTLVQSGKFSSATLSLDGSELNFSSPNESRSK